MSIAITPEHKLKFMRMNQLLGYQPDTYELRWPMLQRLIDLEEREGKEALMKAIDKLIHN